MKAHSMLSALSYILAAQPMSDPFSLPFAVIPVGEEDWDNYMDNTEFDIPVEHKDDKYPAMLYEVSGGGEAVLGYIYQVWDENGDTVAAYYIVM